MPCSKIKNKDLGPIVRGNTFGGCDFSIEINGVEADLSDAWITFRKGSKTGTETIDLTVGSGLTLTGGTVTIEPRLMTEDVANWYFDVKVQFTDDGRIKTYFEGKLPITQNVT